MITMAAAATYAAGLPGVSVGTRWGNRTWLVGDRGFAWQRPLSKADIARMGDGPAPEGDILAVTVENLDAKDAVLSMELPGFFTIQHFNNYPAVLIQLAKARAADVRAAIAEAHRVVSAMPPAKRRKKRPRATPKKR